ncbi:3,4-dihydroxyphenylacetate 2,3-dioxygenase [Salmonella enterica subsp. salamae]|nr:3,4-dihydroxyphenylacetate 2,3-dioxygenase [Salmonella enterica subsp. salamae]SQH41048.1 3,4-dihydroxyphenylacetate 2,3-dioxygenase [Salmonella enterica]
MGKLALAAKITHVPSMYLSELPGKNHGCRQVAIDGHIEIGKRCREMGVDTIIVFDTHWLVNSAYHINCADHFRGVYTSNELPHFIRDMTYDYDGNPELGHLIAGEAVKLGVRAKAHNIPSLKLEYGTLVPMRYMNSDKHFKVVSISAFCTVHDFADSRRLGEAILKAIASHHTTIEDVGKIAREAHVKKLVLSHLVPATVADDVWQQEAMKNYPGPVIVGHDNMTLSVP